MDCCWQHVLTAAIFNHSNITTQYFGFRLPGNRYHKPSSLSDIRIMGAVLATAKHAHIKTDALSLLLSLSVKNKLQLPLNLFSSSVCLMLCYYSSIFVLDEWQYAPANERWTLPFTLIYPIGFALMSFHFLLNEITAEKTTRKIV